MKFPLFLHLLAVAILIGTVTWWVWGGAHFGWTQTSVVDLHFDEVTEISYPVRRDVLMPGIEILAGGLLVTLIIGGVSLFTSRRQKQTSLIP